MADNEPYDALTLSKDASAFASSRFGQHYVARLKKLQRVAREKAENMEFTDSYRAHQSTKAATLGDEIEFFQIAQTVQKTPSLLKRLTNKLKGGDEDDV